MSEWKIKTRTDCRLCHGTNLSLFLDLGKSSLANEFVSDPITCQEIFPLKLYQCDDCYHFQLLDVVNPDLMFKNYLYVSGTSQLMRDHFDQYAKQIRDILWLEYWGSEDDFNLENKLVVDIGSNDGTLLKSLKNKGIQAVGVDPAENLAKKTTEEGFETIAAFFDINVAKQIVEKYGHAHIITCNNCFAHTDDLDKIVEGVKELLLPEHGIFIFEVSNFDKVIETADFTQIYHEHVSYHNSWPLFKFFKRYGMYIDKIEDINVHGGSQRYYIKFGSRTEQEQRTKLGLKNLLLGGEKFRNFKLEVAQIKENKKILSDLKSQGKTIAGITASAKSTTFLHFCDIGLETLDFICDDATEKQNMFSPGKHIPILPFSAIEEKNPDYLLLLSYNFVNFIKNKYPQYKDKWINPFDL